MDRTISFRWLLAALYLGTIVPLLVGVGLFVYVEYRAFLYSSTATRLQDLIHAVVDRTGPPGPPSLAVNPRLLMARISEQVAANGIQVVLLDVSSGFISVTGSVNESLFDHSVYITVRDTGQAVLQQVRTGDENRLAYVLPVTHPSGHVTHVLEASLSLTPVETELAELRLWLVIIVGTAMLLAFMFTPVIGIVAVRPVSKLIATARAVSQGQWQQRSEVPAVAEFRELALAFNKMLSHIEEAVAIQTRMTRQMQRFLADASHELRSPLAVLTSGLQVLERSLLRNDQQGTEQALALLHAEAERMAHIVDDLLLLARVEQPITVNKTNLDTQTIDPLPLLEEVYERAQIIVTGQKLHLRWPRKMIPPLEADAELLRRALNNVIENAIHHTPPESCITLTVEAVPEGCRFVVSDEGAGIPPEQLPCIFERFYRGNTTRQQGHRGSGLGLAIVRAIAAAHGGRIEIASELGAGTEVALIFPTKIQQALSGTSAVTQEDMVSYRVRQPMKEGV